MTTPESDGIIVPSNVRCYMGQHRRFPGSFLLVLAVLAVPSVLYGFVSAAANADDCAAKAKAPHSQAHVKTNLKCE